MTVVERLNFLITNRLPRRSATLFMGWFSKLESTLLTRASIWIWSLFVDDLRLHEAETQTFRSLRDCFTRKLKAGARPITQDPRTVVSPCDAVLGACGAIDGGQLLQAKGFPYTLAELLADDELARSYEGGLYVTLRLKSSMYHRFHAPCDCRLAEISYISGDTWNVNPVALRRIERLFCRNERAVLNLQLADPQAAITLVPVAAILVASMQFEFLDEPLNLRYAGPNRIPANQVFARGDEIGFFEHGSTIILLASGDFMPAPNLYPGMTLRMGQPLLRSKSLLS